MKRSSWAYGMVWFGLVTIAALALPLEAVAQQQAAVRPTIRRYCIVGDAENVAWQWTVRRDEGQSDTGVSEKVPAGLPAIELAKEFVRSINAFEPPGRLRAEVLGTDPDLIDGVCGRGDWDAVFLIENILDNKKFLLELDPAPPPPPETDGVVADCRVDFRSVGGTGSLEFEGGTHCNFNPIITVGAAVPVPGFERWGMVTSVLLVVAAAFVLILCRRFPPVA